LGMSRWSRKWVRALENVFEGSEAVGTRYKRVETRGVG